MSDEVDGNNGETIPATRRSVIDAAKKRDGTSEHGTREMCEAYGGRLQIHVRNEMESFSPGMRRILTQ